MKHPLRVPSVEHRSLLAAVAMVATMLAAPHPTAAQNCLSCPGFDCDGDGTASEECGGSDCDDFDRRRFPGNAEICDAENLDEDCWPVTFGDRDADGDGFVDAACCNVRDRGDQTPICGDDCADGENNVHPNQAEVCNGVDDDCNEQIDEFVRIPVFPDDDGDGHGARGSSFLLVCPGTASVAPYDDDCDDTNPALSPGSIRCVASGPGDPAVEVCAPNGSWEAASCAAGSVCVPQPNGSGVCATQDDPDAPVAIYQAGPGSNPPRSIQEAIDAALLDGVPSEVRIRAGEFKSLETIWVSVTGSDQLTISGFWDATFQSPFAGATELIGNGDGPVIRAEATGRGRLVIENLLLRSGAVDGGLTLRAFDQASVGVSSCGVTQSRSSGDGGGVSVAVYQAASATLVSNSLRENGAERDGGGLVARSFGRGSISIVSQLIEFNQALDGGGLSIETFDESEFQLRETTVGANEAADGSAVALRAYGRSELVAKRNLVTRNLVSDWQVDLRAADAARLWLASSIVADGDADGVSLEALDRSAAYVTNATIADHAGRPVVASQDPGATASIANSIAAANGEAWSAQPPVIVVSNWIGANPRFEEAESGDYSLRSDSPAIGCGTTNPPGGLFADDFFGAPRTTGQRVDCGAVQYAPEPGAFAAALASALAIAALGRRRAPTSAASSCGPGSPP